MEAPLCLPASLIPDSVRKPALDEAINPFERGGVLKLSSLAAGSVYLSQVSIKDSSAVS